MEQDTPQFDMSKGFTPMMQPSPLKQIKPTAPLQSGDILGTLEPQEQPVIARPIDPVKQEFMFDKISTDLEKRYNIDPSKIDAIAKRASDEMGLPEDADPIKRAMFFVEKNQGKDGVLNDYEMGYWKRTGRDVVERASNFGPALAKVVNEYSKQQNEIYADGTKNPFSLGGVKQMAQGALSALGAAGQLASTIVGEGTMGALELADNMVTGGLADQKLYQAMESDGAKKIMDGIAQSAPIEYIMDLASQHPEAARDLGNALGGLMGALDIATLGGASAVGKRIGKEAISGATDLGLSGVGGAISRGVSNIPGVGAVTGAVGDTARGAGKILRDIPDYAITKLSGINPETKAVALDAGNAGKLFGELKSGVKSSEDLFGEVMDGVRKAGDEVSDLGKGYEPIRNLDMDVDVSPIKEVIENILAKKKIAVKGGKLDFRDSAIKKPASQKVISEAFNDLRGRTNLKPDVALNLRAGLDDLVNYDVDISAQGQALVKKIRGEYDAMLKEKIPGLKELDMQYKDARTTYDAAKKDFFNRDGSIKDTAFSRFVNISKDRNAPRLERLSKLAPESSDMSKAILAYEDVNRAMGQKAGSYTQGILGAVGLGGVIGGAGSDNGFLTASSPVAIALLVLTNPKMMVSILQQIAKMKGKVKVANVSAKNFADDMTNKVLEGKFTRTDAEKLQAVVKANPKVQETLSMVPVSEGELIQGQQMDLSPGQNKAFVAQAPNTQKDIVEVNAPNKMVGDTATDVVDEVPTQGTTDVPENVMPEAPTQPVVDIPQEVAPLKEKKLVTPKVSKKADLSSVETLKTEAKKYKTADEFVKSQEDEGKMLFHGSDKGVVVDFSKGKGLESTNDINNPTFHFTDDMDTAKLFSRQFELDNWEKVKNKPGIKQRTNLPNPGITKVILDIKNPFMRGDGKNVTSKLIQKLKKEGYDGIINPYRGGKEYIVFDSKQIKTETQLKKIREEANITSKASKKTPNDSDIGNKLISRAKEFDNIDDFIEDLRKSIDEYSDGDFMTAKPIGREKERLDMIKYLGEKYTGGTEGWFSGAAKLRKEANR